MRRDAILAPVKLSLVEKTHPRGQESNNCRRLMHVGRKCCGGSRLIMIFQKASELVLMIQPCVKMLTHGSGMTFAQAIVQPFVVSVIESLLLQRPFHVPVDLGHKTEVRRFFSCAFNRLGPEWLGLYAPRAFENFR